jgi:uroporphyrinogen-III synthase
MKISRILVSQPRPAGDKSPYFDLSKKYNAEMVFRPFIKTEGLTAKEFRHAKINLNDYTGVIFTSRAAIDNYFRLCEEMRVKVPDTNRYFCTTEAIALYLQKYIVYRKRKIFFGLSGKLNDVTLLAALEKNKKETILFPISDVHQADTSILEEHGIEAKKAVMFRTVSNDFRPDEDLNYDVLIFFSPAGVASLKKNFPTFDQKKDHVYIAGFGPTTIKAIEEAGFTADIAAPNSKHRSMPDALEEFLETHQE